MLRACGHTLLIWVLLCAWVCVKADAQPGEDTRFEGIGQVVQQAIERGELPGCVVAIGNAERVVYTRAWGERTAGEPMTLDTLFDLASLTKPLVTATAVAQLIERGLLTLETPASRVLPALRVPDKQAITVRQLLLHTSGLPSVGPLAQMENGAEAAQRAIAAMKLRTKPGTTFEYSDLGYILLGQLVEAVSARSLDRFARDNLFAPLSLDDTHYKVEPGDVARSAPTELRDEQVIRGVVDDPRAYRLDGVAGHAGLFSSAHDLSSFARMLLRGGELDGRRVLSASSVDTMLAVQRAGKTRRSLGWDVSSSYALGRGRLFSATAVGHGGYTGTSLWLDREQDLFVLILSNRVHAGPRGSLHPLASSIADIAVRALRTHPATLRMGSDVLREEAFARLRGRKVALLTHDAARDTAGVSTLERLANAPGLALKVVFTPEHGLSGKQEGRVENGRFRKLPMISLFGKARRPTPEMLREADTVVVDLVDVGTRFYTYMATILEVMNVAAELDLSVVLLDRPNPIDGIHVEGPVSEASYRSFVNYQPLPLRHGMTAGELASYLIQERGLKTRLSVVRVEGWSREASAADLSVAFRAPSPNLGSPEQTLLYPAVGLVEGTNVSVGRGTSRAFSVLGAPFLNGAALAATLATFALPGVAVAATRFQPSVGPYAGVEVPGVSLQVTDRKAFSAARTGVALIEALFRQRASGWDPSRLQLMVAHARALQALEKQLPFGQVEATWRAELARFNMRRTAHLLY